MDHPCGLRRSCHGLDDGNHADHALNCTNFFTCLEEEFLGNQPCNAGKTEPVTRKQRKMIISSLSVCYTYLTFRYFFIENNFRCLLLSF